MILMKFKLNFKEKFNLLFSKIIVKKESFLKMNKMIYLIKIVKFLNLYQ
jgi:hypothetical protein